MLNVFFFLNVSYRGEDIWGVCGGGDDRCFGVFFMGSSIG